MWTASYSGFLFIILFICSARPDQWRHITKASAVNLNPDLVHLCFSSSSHINLPLFSFTTSVKESYLHPYDQVTEEACSDPQTAYRCLHHRYRQWKIVSCFFSDFLFLMVEGPSFLFILFLFKDHLQDCLQTSSKNRVSQEVPVLSRLLWKQKQMCPWVKT